MATTDYPVNHPLAVKLWSKKIAREVLKQTMASKFMGTSSNSMIQIFDETSKGPGDRVRVPLRMQLTGMGVTEGTALEGNEEALSTYFDDTVINFLGHAVRVETTIDAQRVPFSAREEARMGLTDWFSDRIDDWAANHLTGYTLGTGANSLYAGFNSTVAPSYSAGGSNNRWILGTNNADTEASLSSSAQKFTLSILDLCVRQAKTASPLIRPLKVGGSDYFVAFLHPDQVLSLRTNTNTGQWLDIQKAAMQGGEIEDNPIFSGALGVYNGVVLHEWTRLPGGANKPLAATTTRRGVFAGAQALAAAWGQGYSEQPRYVEDYFDYNRQFGVSVQTIMGVKALRFNSIDFGKIVFSTFETGTAG
jgi:N4-gp56 family major capsid protein